MAQVNWWLPLYPLTETRTMKVWPEAFDKPVPNSSRTWDFEQLMSGTQRDYPMLPSTTETIGAPVSVTIEAGEVLAFAAAHLHAGVNDAKPKTIVEALIGIEANLAQHCPPKGLRGSILFE